MPVLIPVILFMGCERDDLELGLPPKDNQFEVNYFEKSFNPVLNWNDSLNSNSPTRLLVGAYDDTRFGRVTASGFLTFSPTSVRPPVLREGTKSDSMILTLRLNYAYNEFPAARLAMQVHEINSYFEEFNPHYTFDQEDIGEYVGGYTGIFRTEILERVENFQDTLFYLNIYFTKQYADRILDAIRIKSSLIYDGGEAVKEIIPGLAFIPDEAQAEGIFGFSLSDTDSKVSIYFTQPGYTDQEQFSFKLGLGYNYISPNRNTLSDGSNLFADIPAPKVDFDPDPDYTYYQSGTGLTMSFDVEELKQISDTLKNFIVNTAVLELQNIPTTGSLGYPPPRLRMLLTDETNEIRFFNGRQRVIYQGSRSDSIALLSPSFASSSTFVSLIYVPELNRYQADVTYFVQGLLEGRGDLTRILLSDYDITAGQVNGFKVRKEDVKVKIFYTKSR